MTIYEWALAIGAVVALFFLFRAFLRGVWLSGMQSSWRKPHSERIVPCRPEPFYNLVAGFGVTHDFGNKAIEVDEHFTCFLLWLNATMGPHREQVPDRSSHRTKAPP
jgi:hypothetical protein